MCFNVFRTHQIAKQTHTMSFRKRVFIISLVAISLTYAMRLLFILKIKFLAFSKSLSKQCDEKCSVLIIEK